MDTFSLRAEYLESLDHRIFSQITPEQLSREQAKLYELFHDDSLPIFIPAGRTLVTTLSKHIHYLYASMEPFQLHNTDLTVNQFVLLMIQLRPLFADGLDGVYRMGDTEIRSILPAHLQAFELLKVQARQILHGEYRYVQDQDRLYYADDDDKYVDIYLASSGQQEAVWILNILACYLSSGKKVTLIVEEPESNLYPDAQRKMAELLSLFSGVGNTVLTATHSPYILGTFNYLLLASQASEKAKYKISERLPLCYWRDHPSTSAWYLDEGQLLDAIDPSDDLYLIQNDRIDNASQEINLMTDFILEQDDPDEM